MAPKSSKTKNSKKDNGDVVGDLANGIEKITIATATAGEAGGPIVYSDDELDAIRKVRTHLVDVLKIDSARIGLKTLALTTIVSKLRIEEAAKKYVLYLNAVENCGVPNLRDDVVLQLSPTELEVGVHSYALCGRDDKGRSIQWVKGTKDPYPVDIEAEVVKCAIMYHTAIHAGAVSLRNGISFVIDTSNNKEAKRPKNHKKLQKTWQAMPMRPQSILIAGASKVTRLVINALITAASLFTKQKVLDRIKFVSVDDAVSSFPKDSTPTYLGGDGGGNDVQGIVKWTKERLEGFPVPIL